MLRHALLELQLLEHRHRQVELLRREHLRLGRNVLAALVHRGKVRLVGQQRLPLRRRRRDVQGRQPGQPSMMQLSRRHAPVELLGERQPVDGPTVLCAASSRPLLSHELGGVRLVIVGRRRRVERRLPRRKLAWMDRAAPRGRRAMVVRQALLCLQQVRSLQRLEVSAGRQLVAPRAQSIRFEHAELPRRRHVQPRVGRTGWLRVAAVLAQDERLARRDVAQRDVEPRQLGAVKLERREPHRAVAHLQLRGGQVDPPGSEGTSAIHRRCPLLRRVPQDANIQDVPTVRLGVLHLEAFGLRPTHQVQRGRMLPLGLLQVGRCALHPRDVGWVVRQEPRAH
mmetsp:Transcript_29349/g.80458  ORF Transcript_29349/g.80458 Transcript_29349/m.80458 type:complete len:339 (+) Transcript_29349:661-1677(+)